MAATGNDLKETDNPWSSPSDDSSDEPSSYMKDGVLHIKFSKKMEEALRAEVARLEMFSVICRVIGPKPSLGKLRNLIKTRLQGQIGAIEVSDAIGVEFKEELKQSPLNY